MAHKESSVNWFGQIGGGGGRATQPRPQVSAPSLSQIPGLSKASGDASYGDEPQRPFYRDTDSAYVRLAKQGGRTDLLRMDQQDAAPTESKGAGYTIPSWMQKDSANEDLHNAELEFNDSGRRADQWDSRQSSPPPPGDQDSNYSWSRRMSAEGDRQPMQTESQSAYASKQSRDAESPANWRSEQFQQQQQQQYSRQNNGSDAASDAGRASYQSPEQKARDNARPDWLQWNPANNNNSRRESANSRQHEESTDSRGSAYGQRYQGNGSPQKPYADHGYQMPMSTETSSAYAEKPFQSPAGERRSSLSKLPEEFYTKSDYSALSKQKPSASLQQPAGINQLKHSDSMSKIMSFGYLKDAEKGDSHQMAASRSQPRLDRDYIANTYTTEYKEKMHGTGDASSTNSVRSHNGSVPSTGGYVPTPISDPGYRRRKQSMDDRPDFFKIGSNEPQSVPTYGIRKPSAESRPDFFGSSERGSSAATVNYGKIRHDAENKPDFFKIGSLDNYAERQVEDKRPDDGGILDKLNGYHGIPQKSSYRRRKMDINGPMLTMPVKAISRF